MYTRLVASSPSANSSLLPHGRVAYGDEHGQSSNLMLRLFLYTHNIVLRLSQPGWESDRRKERLNKLGVPYSTTFIWRVSSVVHVTSKLSELIQSLISELIKPRQSYRIMESTPECATCSLLPGYSPT